jgi:hypothetical protein
MDRRDFLLSAGAAGALSALALAEAARGHAPEGAARTQSEAALRELLALVGEVNARYLGPEWGITRPGDVSDGHRFLMHALQAGLVLHLESDPERPMFRRIVTPGCKLLGDNPDAVYFEAPLRGGRRYRVRGNLAGATYTSFTIEAGAADGSYATGSAGALNDTQFAAAADGSYEITLAPDPPAKNGLALPANARSLTTRHYFESKRCAAADPALHVPLAIEALDAKGPPPTPDDATVAASLRRVANYLRGVTLAMPPPDPAKLPNWVSTVPNRFPKPAKPGDMAFAAVDNAYSMAPYALGPDEALLIRGRFPRCRFANVALWNRFLQTYDYVNRRVSLNRVQVQLEPDGSFRIAVAHRDPGIPNWLDTEGRPSGTVYWRFLLPEGEIATPETEVVPLQALRGRV